MEVSSYENCVRRRSSNADVRPGLRTSRENWADVDEAILCREGTVTTRRKLRAVTGSQNRSIIKQDFDGPVFRGSGSFDYLCAKCSNLLMEAMPPNIVFNLSFECRKCKSLSASPDLPAGAVLVGSAITVPVGTSRLTDTISFEVKPGPIVGAGSDGRLPDLHGLPAIPFKRTNGSTLH